MSTARRLTDRFLAYSPSSATAGACQLIAAARSDEQLVAEDVAQPLQRPVRRCRRRRGRGAVRATYRTPAAAQT